MTRLKYLALLLAFCCNALLSDAQPGDYSIKILQTKVGYIYTESGEATFKLSISEDVDIYTVAESMQSSICDVISVNNYFNRITIVADIDNIYDIIYRDYILWIEEVLPIELNSSSTPSAHNGRLTHEFGYLGAGVTIGVWEGSAATEHLDILGRYTNYTSLGNQVAINHTMAVLGIMAGNGNMNQNLPGMATKASVVVRDYQGDITQEMLDAIDSNSIIITQNSYSISPTADPCAVRGSYKIISRDIDKLAYDYPYLVHVYSAGNGQTDCSANGTTGYRTIPSGYQSAKNVITVGAVDKDNIITDESAWGPVRDGRIKPEVVALGEGATSIGSNNSYVTDLKGTSYAAPVVSGVAAQVASRYKVLKGVYPPSSLVRAAICNSADDLGTPGPDYQYGFGKVNAYKAVYCIASNKYIIDSVNNQGQKLYSVVVPANTKQLKATIAWTDPEGDPANPKALVNDIDMGMLDPGMNGYLPWVLDSTANNKQLPATRGNDRINNIEQITIDNPAFGSHSILVLGESVPNGYQTFSIAVEVVPEELSINYPMGEESFIPGEVIDIWWNSNGVGNYKLEYSLNNGSSWNLIKDGIDNSINSYEWEVPETITSEAKLRITQGGKIDSTEVFNIMATPVNLVGYGCDSIAKLFWNKSSGASLYNLYQIKDGSANYITSTLDTSYIIEDLQNDSAYWFAVVAKNNNGVESKRTQFIKVVPALSPDYHQVSVWLNKDTVCIGDTVVIKPETSLGATDVELEWNNNGTWETIELTNNSAKKEVYEDIVLRAKYTDICGNVKYSDEESVIVDSVSGKFSVTEVDPFFTYRFTPEYQNSRADYKWSFGDGGVSIAMIPEYQYSFDPKFKVRLVITSPHGCSVTDSFLFVGINDVQKNIIKAYPNPANTYVDVVLDEGYMADATLSIYNILGKQIDNIEIVKLNNEICRINTATLPEGVYVVKLVVSNKTYTKKILIER